MVHVPVLDYCILLLGVLKVMFTFRLFEDFYYIPQVVAC